VSDRVKIINEELCVTEKGWFPSHAIRPQGARKVINYVFWRLFPSSDESREDVVLSFASRNAVEPIANAMGAPYAHDTSCQALFPILQVKLGALCPPFSPDVIDIVLQFRIPWPLSDFGQAIAAACLIVEFSFTFRTSSQNIPAPKLFLRQSLEF
jgi:hypothetical protein